MSGAGWLAGLIADSKSLEKCPFKTNKNGSIVIIRLRVRQQWKMDEWTGRDGQLWAIVQFKMHREGAKSRSGFLFALFEESLWPKRGFFSLIFKNLFHIQMKLFHVWYGSDSNFNQLCFQSSTSLLILYFQSATKVSQKRHWRLRTSLNMSNITGVRWKWM